jgi:dihydrofolate reductase
VSKVRIDMSISLDGFIAGPNDRPGQELGEGGMQLHEWGLGLKSWRERHGLEGGETGPESDVLEEAFANVGAVVMGRRMFDLAEGPWGDEPPFYNPVFVVTHRPRETLAKKRTTFTFVTDGVESTVEQARAAAGDKDVSISGGAQISQQCLRAGLVDELQLHVVPVLLGGGKRLLDDVGRGELELDRVVDSARVTHLRYRVVK